jgi:hypothetical protein
MFRRLNRFSFKAAVAVVCEYLSAVLLKAKSKAIHVTGHGGP